MNEKSETHGETPLKPRQRAVLIGLLSGTIEETSAKTGVSVTTIWRWRKLDTFKAELERLQNEIFFESMARLKAMTPDALAVIVEILKDPAREDSKLRAAGMVLEHARALRREEDLEKRIAEIESAISALR